MLIDNFNRIHDYLRISLTDACNFRCQYCMPDEKVNFMPSAKLMQAHEINHLAKEFVKLGVKKIRLTGGEPLIRNDAHQIIQNLGRLPVELTITSNGSRVHEFIETFKEVGIKSVNISLDTLNKDKFKTITRRNYFDKVYENIFLLIENGFHVKVNVVVMRGVNDDEINDFVALTKHHQVHVRFIEFMPFTGNQWNNTQVYSYKEIIDKISTEYEIVKMKDEVHDTAKKFKPLMHEGTFAIISTMSAPFCSDCNRMRLTADGKMKNCLFSKGEVDLLSALRNEQEVEPLIRQCVLDKKEALGGQFTADYEKIDAMKIDNRSMISIGG